MNNQQMTLVEINSTSGAFSFKTFYGKDSVVKANLFCEKLPSKSDTLSAYVVKTVNNENG